MKVRTFFVVLMLGVLLSGCSFSMNGEYVWTEKYEPSQSQMSDERIQISNYLQLQNVLERMVETGTTRNVISVEAYDAGTLNADFVSAVEKLKDTHPIAAYAVDQITCEAGTIAGGSVLVIQISYLHNRSQISKIITVKDNAAAMEVVYEALAEFREIVLLKIEDYRVTDFSQAVEAYAQENPDIVMEVPRVVEGVYPKTGSARLVELTFHYQTSRDDMKVMQDVVAPIFNAAVLDASNGKTNYEKYARLYTFLMNRYVYTIEPTTTPAFSLLYHGIGDSKAFAQVYAAICRRAGLECILVTGTRDGQEWYWNIIRYEGAYYHMDLLRCIEEGRFDALADGDMTGYVWNYSAYPDCGFKENMSAEK